MQQRSPSDLKGIDVSHWENDSGRIDFAKAKAAGVSVCYVKATEGATYTDPYFRANIMAAHAAGLKVGAYHFANPDRDAESQAQYFAAAIKGLPMDCLPVIDYETASTLTRDQHVALAKNLLDTVRALTMHEAVLYTYTSFIQEHFTADLAGYKLWIADYRSDAAPGENGIWNNWAGFQYTERGSVTGLSGAVDLDSFTADILIPAAKPVSTKVAFPGAQYFGPGKSNNYILMLDKALIAHGYSRYYLLGRFGASRSWGNGTFKACRAFQEAQGWSGSGANGIPGSLTWTRLGL